MADAVWYVGKEGEQRGPFTEEDVRGMAARGELGSADLLWKEGMAEWQPLSQLAEFADEAAKAPPPQAKQPGVALPPWCLKWWETFRGIITAPDSGLQKAAEEKPPWFALTWVAAAIIVLALVALQEVVKLKAAVAPGFTAPGLNPGTAFLRTLVKGVVVYGISFGALMLALGPILKSEAGWSEAVAILGLASLPVALLGFVAFALAWIHLYFYVLFVPAIVAQALFFYHVLLHTSKASRRAALYTIPAIYLGVFIIYGLLTLAMKA